jgi:hypothetical protein
LAAAAELAVAGGAIGVRTTAAAAPWEAAPALTVAGGGRLTAGGGGVAGGGGAGGGVMMVAAPCVAELTAPVTPWAEATEARPASAAEIIIVERIVVFMGMNLLVEGSLHATGSAKVGSLAAKKPRKLFQ